MNATSKKVFVAMSGGVDSSVAAALLKHDGYEVAGVTMELWPGDNCRTQTKAEAARSVCRALDIPHTVTDLAADFNECVVAAFCQEYARGRTPNPCVLCNTRVKFGILLDWAMSCGADYLATGHYARTVRSNGTYVLSRGSDPAKDQSYVLYGLGQEELKHVLFPLGDHRKEDVRRIAQQMGLPVWDKAESQEICFIHDQDYRSFLAERIPGRPGAIIDVEGNVLGEHAGIGLFTIGQRRGLGIVSREPLYVTDIDSSTNTVVVGPEALLYSNGLRADRLNFVQGSPPECPASISARIRYRSPEAKAVLRYDGRQASLEFEEPQRAITPGQSVVLYDGDAVLGGGIIEGRSCEPAPEIASLRGR